MTLQEKVRGERDYGRKWGRDYMCQEGEKKCETLHETPGAKRAMTKTPKLAPVTEEKTERSTAKEP